MMYYEIRNGVVNYSTLPLPRDAWYIRLFPWPVIPLIYLRKLATRH